MTVIVLMLLILIAMLVYAIRRDVAAPWIAVILGALPVLLCLIVADAAGWSFRATGFLVIGILAGLPMLVVIGSIACFAIKRGGDAPTEIRPLGVTLLILTGAVIVSCVFVQQFEHIELLSVGFGFLGVLSLVSGYLLAMGFGFGLHALLLTLAKKQFDPDFIIVNGGRLQDGRLHPQLIARLDTAIALYNKGGGRATIIPSGGWTSDDVVSEADAMVEYLLARAIPGEQIVPEDQSTTTRENLENSKLIIQLRSRSAPATVAYVTSNYHVYRTGLIARSVGIEAYGVASMTPWHQLPAAVVREVAALFWMHKYWHALPILAATLYYQVGVLPSERY